MPMNIPIISFNGGEYSPLIDVRSDLQKYSSGCRTLQNMIPRIYGNVERRPGTEYIASTKDSSLVARLVAFIYSDSIAYQMEFGSEYIRYYYNGAQLVGSTTTPTYWADATDYTIGEFVTHGGTVYRCLVAHTSEDDGDHDDPASNFTDWVVADLDSDDYPICETPTPYQESELFELQFRQIADVIRITHNSHAPRKLTRTTAYTFDLSTIDFTKGPFLKRNDLANDDDITLTPSAITGDITITASDDVFTSANIGSLIKITQPRATTKTSGSGTSTGVIGEEIPIKGVFTLNIHGEWTASVDLERNVNNEDWEIYRTYVSANDKHIAQTFTEEEDNVKYRIKCTSYTSGTIEADITLDDSSQGGIARITGYISPTEVLATVLVDFANRAADDLGLATEGGSAAFSIIANSNIGNWYEVSPHANDNDHSTKVGFGQDDSGSNLTGTYKVELTLAADSRVTGIEYYRHWKIAGIGGSGYEKIYVYYGGAYHLVKTINYALGSGTGLVTVTDGAPWSDVSMIKIEAHITASKFRTWTTYAHHYLYELTVWAIAEVDVVDKGLPANPSKRWYEGAWSNRRGYPAALTFFEERSVYGGSIHQPQTIWLSESGNYDNFEEGTKDSDSFWRTLSSDKRDSIQWMASLEALVLSTNGGEWRIRAKTTDERITPTNFNARQQTSYGSKRIQPLQVGDAILFIDSVGRKKREMTYRDDKLKYVSPDLTALAEHITLSGITCIAHQKNPDSIIWCVLDNGKLLSMTYERDQNVVAWAVHLIGGTNVEVESVSVIPGDDEDEVWISVARTVNGSTARTIEQLQPRVDVDLEDAWFLDSGLAFDGDSVTITNVTDNGDGTTTITAENDFDDGDTVYLDGIVGPDELNGRYFVVTNATSSDFEIRRFYEEGTYGEGDYGDGIYGS